MESIRKIEDRIVEIEICGVELTMAMEDLRVISSLSGFRDEALTRCNEKISAIERLIKTAEAEIAKYEVAQREFSTKSRWYQFWNKSIMRAPVGRLQRKLDTKKAFLEECKKRLKA